MPKGPGPLKKSAPLLVNSAYFRNNWEAPHKKLTPLLNFAPMPFSTRHAALTPERSLLTRDDRELLENLETQFHFSFQQSRQITQWFSDCHNWEEAVFFSGVRQTAKEDAQHHQVWTRSQRRDWIFNKIRHLHSEIRRKEKSYSLKKAGSGLPAYQMENKELKGNIFRLCPAASERAVCCNLKTLNLVDNCAMACSYCVLQSHYDEPVIKIPVNLKEKLDEIQLSPRLRYRICTGEYSDSLLWGNRNGILDDLCDFAAAHSNIILEFKTKTANIGYFEKNQVPKNICCSWSLNPETVVHHEEHKTASLSARLEAARKVADRGIKVGFHFHPMMYYKGWRKDYENLFEKVTDLFEPAEVLWVSLGTVTLVKGVIQELSRGKIASKILQMETERTPDGKITYAFPIRKMLYENALERLKPWKGTVFQYLCMEHKPMWDEIMDTTYSNMAEFDEAFNDSAFSKLAE